MRTRWLRYPPERKLRTEGQPGARGSRGMDDTASGQRLGPLRATGRHGRHRRPPGSAQRPGDRAPAQDEGRVSLRPRQRDGMRPGVAGTSRPRDTRNQSGLPGSLAARVDAAGACSFGLPKRRICRAWRNLTPCAGKKSVKVPVEGPAGPTRSASRGTGLRPRTGS